MLSIGLMTLNKQSEQTYFTEIAKRSHQYGIKCFRFSPANINPITEKVGGDYFNPRNSKWEACEFPLPNVLYDRCFYGEDPRSKQCMSIVNWLKTREDTIFLGYGLPNKLELYKTLSQSNLSPYLPHTEPFITGIKLIDGLKRSKPVVLKPINGSQGHGIYYIEKKRNGILIRTDKKDTHISHTFKDPAKAINWLNQLTENRKYLVQPYLDLLDNSNQPFDIRVLLQKDSAGSWQEIGKGIRTGKRGGIISNLNAGGECIPFEEWLADVPSSQHLFICEELSDILKNLPAVLEKDFLPLFEIGVDIGAARDGSIWILDVNSKPGRKTVLNTSPELMEQLYSAPLLYGKTLISSRENERRMTNEKTISD